MIYQRLSRVMMLTFAALTSPLYAHAQGTLIPFNHNPVMTAQASAPVTVLVDSRVIYQITALDSDTWQNVLFPAVFVNVFDQHLTLTPISVASMKPGYIYRLQGFDPTNKATWNVTGTAVSTPGTYTDVWTVANPNPLLQLVDDSITVEQIVFVDPKPVPPVVPLPLPPKPVTPMPVVPKPPVKVLMSDVQNILALVNNTPSVQTTAMQNFVNTGAFSTDVDGEISGVIAAFADGQVSNPNGALAAALVSYEVDRGNIPDDTQAPNN